MKPPARRRNPPNRFFPKKHERTTSRRSKNELPTAPTTSTSLPSSSSPSSPPSPAPPAAAATSRTTASLKVGDHRKLLYALKKQHSLHRELDVSALHAAGPKCSLEESFIKSLKMSVARQVFLQVHRQLREERQKKVPIQLWADLANRMAGRHEETISASFSQMLVIAATEPHSLRHSEPPHPLHNAPSSFAAPQMSASQRNQMSASRGTSNRGAGKLSGTGAGLTPSLHSPPGVRASPGQPTSSANSPQTATPGNTRLQPPSSISAPDVRPEAVFTENRLAADNAARSSSKSIGTEGGQAPLETHIKPKPTVDFERIYCYLSKVSKMTSENRLTAMESAVVLDLLMSLQEEIPLLNGRELQRHLIDIHGHLNTALKQPRVAPEEDTASVTKSGNSAETAAGEGAEQPAAAEIPDPTVNWEDLGLCPLNPFMVPLSLLARKESS
uniref:Uncharacterized protein n=1 Tax=Denticeps clupeoides TaxID=299321 RepID=A0AAY4AFV0_9TELE